MFRTPNPLYGLPLYLYGVGLVLIFSGIVWAALTHRSRSLQVPRLQAQTEVDHGISAANAEVENIRRPLSHRGVEALFSPERDLATSQRVSRNIWLSKTFLFGVVEYCFALLLYAGLVLEYNSSTYIRSWVRASLPFIEFLLNFYAFVAVAVIATVIALVVLIQSWRRDSNDG